MAADLELNFLSDLLVKMDMATMACSLEARSPFLDHHLAQYVCRLPESFKTKGLTPKRLLRDAYSAHLAPEVVRAPKRGFEVPMARWLAEDFRDLLGDTLGQPRALVREYVDGALLDGVLTGRSLSERNRPQLVYALLVLELWLRHRGAKT